MPAEVAMPGKATSPAEVTTSQHYDAHVDLEGFRDLFLAQQHNYLRKLHLMGAIFIGALTIMFCFSLADDFDTYTLLITILFAAFTVWCIVMLVHPMTMISTRKPLVHRWFYVHGVEDPNKVPFKQLEADYTVEVGEYGFSEETKTTVAHTPWFALVKKPVESERGTYFVLGKGKDSSLAYSMLGINWALRDEEVCGVLFIPREVVAAQPGLVSDIAARVAKANALVKEGCLGADTEEGRQLAAWLNASGPRQ